MAVEVITLLLRLAIVLLCGFVAPAFKAWLEAKARSEAEAKIKETARTAVFAAEQIYNTAKKADPDGTLRRRFVKDAIKRVAYETKVALTDREISEIMEAAVQELNFATHSEKLLIGEYGE